ncbi:MAG: phosphate acyltransferase PlsX [Clostridia bacterium]|nr:phosphate acyltransferase PlsX [Clostridia bacterium]
MEDLKIVVLDAYGGDNAPVETVKGAVMALNQEKDLKIIITGNEEEILKELQNYKYDKDRLEIVHTSEVITCNDVPTMSIKQKKDSSLVVAFKLLRERQDIVALVSAGSTGAILTGGFLLIGRLKGVSRPALAPLLPTLMGTQTLLVDCGANMDAKPLNLCHFALMGTEYMKSIGVENPKVALLSVGTEDEKGNELVKKTLPLLKTLPINFVGNMEARDLLSGKYDVVVCDGFAGNVLLKGTEGGIIALKSILKQEIKSSFMNKIGAVFMKKAFKGMKQKLNYEANGGSPFIGCKKTIMKCHGSAEAESICNTILASLELEKVNLNQRIEKVIEENKIEIIEE